MFILSYVFRPMAGKFPETRHFRYWQVQAAAGKLRVVLPPGTMNLQAWLMKPATLQKRAWDLHRSLVVTSILRCGRSISSQSSSSPQKIKQVSQHALEIHHLFSGIQKTEAPLYTMSKRWLSVKPVIHEMPACFMISFLERCDTYLNFDER